MRRGLEFLVQFAVEMCGFRVSKLNVCFANEWANEPFKVKYNMSGNKICVIHVIHHFQHVIAANICPDPCFVCCYFVHAFHACVLVSECVCVCANKRA